MKKIRIVLLSIFGAILLTITTCFIYYAVVVKDSYLSDQKLLLSTDKITLYDELDEKISSSVSLIKTNSFSISEIPLDVRYAFIDTEDKRFYSHHGFDYRRIAKATLNNLRSRSFKEGASTISQQLIKNTHLSQEKTVKRKLREFKLTYELEKKYSKDEILEKYLNSIYFGHNCFGLASASEFYFSKEPKDLTLSDGAILAGLVQSPNNYSPFKNPDKCLKRKEVVLSAMVKQGHISSKEKEEALRIPLPEYTPSSDSFKSYFSRVYEELEELSDIFLGKLCGSIQIYTYYDEELQNYLYSLSKRSDTDKVYSVLDNNTLGFKGYYSTIGNKKRLPGSIIKPLLVYAPAIEEGYLSPATPILDEKTNFGDYTPQNYGEKYLGYTSARDCLAYSLNIPAVKILSSVGIKKSVSYISKMNLNVSEDDYSLALALGGMKEGFTLDSIMNAYSVFARNGNYNKAGFIRKIIVDGKTIYSKNNKETRIFSEGTSYLTTDMLKTAVRKGTAKKLRSLTFPIAAKTGTSGNKNGNTDAYTVSITSDCTIGVWLGNANNSMMTITGGSIPAEISYKINEYIAQKHVPEDFIKPDDIIRVNLDSIEYSITHNIVLADENAPLNGAFSELFQTKHLPKTKSQIFSYPTISMPRILYLNGKVTISLVGGIGEYYQYTIDRYDYATHTIVYEGAYMESIIDSSISEGKNYVYTITPSYNSNKGKTISLPEITTKKDELKDINPEPPPNIVNKDWWNY